MKKLIIALVVGLLTVSAQAEFLYVSSQYNGLLSFSINPNTGALTKLPSSPLLKPAGIDAITLDHTGKRLYAATSSAIYGYQIASNGQLIPLPGSPYKTTYGGALEYGSATIVVDPYNRFLFAPANDNSIAVFQIRANGSLVPAFGSPFPSPGAGSITVDPFGRFLYVLGEGPYPTYGATVSVFQILAGGSLRVAYPATSTGHEYGQSIKAEKTGRFIYIANDLETSINVYQVSPNGSLSLVPGSGTVMGGPWCEQLAYSPINYHLYLTTDESGLDVYQLNALTGLPESVGGYGVGGWGPPLPFPENRPVGVCVSPNGKFVYVGNSNVDVDPSPMSLRAFKVGPTGLLTLVAAYYPLGAVPYFRYDPRLSLEEGWPSSMVVAP
jgi:6-phosphogluconolactonase (cycloisomerase 2 family)